MSDLEETIAAARAAPDDCAAQIAAAYGCDRVGREHDAIVFYDRAHHLGVPAEKRTSFEVGYGSTLRNVGRLDDSLAVLRAAIERQPDYAAYRAFLGLTLHSMGRHSEAAAAFIEASLVGNAELDGYDRALRSYRDELLGEVNDPRP